MIWLRFYYFSFLYFYRKKGEDWDSWFRSLLLVELTFFFLILFICRLIDPTFFADDKGEFDNRLCAILRVKEIDFQRSIEETKMADEYEVPPPTAKLGDVVEVTVDSKIKVVTVNEVSTDGMSIKVRNYIT